MKMNTKFIAALAVFAMAFAGFGAMAVSEDNDAATDEDLTITFGKVLSMEVVDAMIADGATVTYIAERNDVKADIDNIDAYNAYIKPFLKAGKVTIPLEIVKFLSASTTNKGAMVADATAAGYDNAVVLALAGYYDLVTTGIAGSEVIDTDGAAYKAVAKLSDDDLVATLAVFTGVTLDSDDEIVSGMITVVKFAEAVSVKTTLEFVDTKDAEAAVAAAVAIVEAFYADYSSPEEVQAAIDAAVAQYKDYLSPEMVEKAKQAAVEKYIIDHPVVEKENKAFFYAFIVVLAALIAVAGVFAYKDYVKPKMAAKKAAAAAVEPPKQ